MSPMDYGALEAIVERWRDKTVLVVGDLMLDEYRHGDVERMSPEAPVPVVRVPVHDGLHALRGRFYRHRQQQPGGLQSRHRMHHRLGGPRMQHPERDHHER